MASSSILHAYRRVPHALATADPARFDEQLFCSTCVTCNFGVDRFNGGVG